MYVPSHFHFEVPLVDLIVIMCCVFERKEKGVGSDGRLFPGWRLCMLCARTRACVCVCVCVCMSSHYTVQSFTLSLDLTVD